MSRLSSMTRILRDEVTGALSCPSRCLLAQRHGGRGGIRFFGSRLGNERQRQNKCRPRSPAAAGGPDRAPHLVHGDRSRVQTEAVAVLFGRKAKTEDVLQ